MANKDLQFNTENERLAYAKKLAKEKLSQMNPKTVEQLGEAQILSDLEHQILMSIPVAKRKI